MLRDSKNALLGPPQITFGTPRTEMEDLYKWETPLYWNNGTKKWGCLRKLYSDWLEVGRKAGWEEVARQGILVTWTVLVEIRRGVQSDPLWMFYFRLLSQKKTLYLRFFSHSRRGGGSEIVVDIEPSWGQKRHCWSKRGGVGGILCSLMLGLRASSWRYSLNQIQLLGSGYQTSGVGAGRCCR